MNWLKKKTGPPAVTLETAEAAKTFKDGAEVVVIGFFKDPTSDDAKVFLEVATNSDEFPFGITSEDAVYKELGASKDGIVLYKKVAPHRDNVIFWLRWSWKRDKNSGGFVLF